MEQEVQGAAPMRILFLFLIFSAVACTPRNWHDGKCDDIQLGSDRSALPLTGQKPQAGFSPTKGTTGSCVGPDGGVVSGMYDCVIEVKAPYGGSCVDGSGEGGAWVCGVWLDQQGKVVGVGTDCFN